MKDRRTSSRRRMTRRRRRGMRRRRVWGRTSRGWGVIGVLQDPHPHIGFGAATLSPSIHRFWRNLMVTTGL
jgi:hypothetical protein